MTLVKFNHRSPARGYYSPVNNSFPDLIDYVFNMDTDYSPVSKPAANIMESDSEYTIEMALAGINKKEIKVSTEKNQLTVSADWNDGNKDDLQYSHREFGYTSFSRNFMLPKSINQEKITAQFENGILRIVLPKKEESITQPTREIKIS